MVTASLASTAFFIFFFQAEDGIRDLTVTGVQTCALPICCRWSRPLSPPRTRSPWSMRCRRQGCPRSRSRPLSRPRPFRSEEHTSELQSQSNLVCRLLLEKKKIKNVYAYSPRCYALHSPGRAITSQAISYPDTLYI